MILYGAANTFADVSYEQAMKFVKVTQKTPTLDKFYYEFEYPDFEFKGKVDAMLNVRFTFCSIYGDMDRVATMYRCHDNMKRENFKWGAMQVVGTRNVNKSSGETINTKPGDNPKGVRIVTIRFYPTYEASKIVSHFLFEALWDEDNDGSVQFDIHTELEVSRDLTYDENGHWGSLDFDGASYYVNNYSVGNFKSEGWKRKVRVCDNHDYAFSGKAFYDGDFSDDGRYVLDDLSFETEKTCYIWNYLIKDTDVENGSYKSNERNVTVAQKVPAGTPLTLNYKTSLGNITIDGISNINKYGYHEILLSGDKKMQADIYRVNGNEEPTTDMYIATVDLNQGSVTRYQDNVDPYKPSVSYIIYPRDVKWTKHSILDRKFRKRITASVLNFNLNGQGSKDNPYQINDYIDFTKMRIYVNNGKAAKGTHWILRYDMIFPKAPDDNIMFETGVEEHPFDGVFDGNGHTITVNLDDNNKDTKALFGYVGGGVIKNLKVTGNINVYSLFGAGFVKRMYGGTIENCLSDVTLTSCFDGDGTMAGFCSTTEPASTPNLIKNCVFTGRIQAASGKNTNKCGGFIGWSRKGTSTAHLVNCLNLGSYSNIDTYGCDAMVRNGAEIENCYYLNPFGGNATGAVKLNDSHKGLALFDGFGLGYYHFSLDAYPVLKTFSGDDIDLELDGNSRLVTTRDYAGADILFKRYFEESERCTLTLPFDVDEAKVQEMGRFYTLNKIVHDVNVVVFTPVSGGLKANTPYVLEPAQTVRSLRFDNVTLKSTASMPDASKAPSSSRLVGTTEPVMVPAGAYGYSAGDTTHERGEFVRVGTNVTLPAFCAYLWINGNAPRTMEAVFTDEDGGITGIETLYQDDENPAIYSLDGRKLDKPERGINIINGKKVVVR